MFLVLEKSKKNITNLIGATPAYFWTSLNFTTSRTLTK